MRDKADDQTDGFYSGVLAGVFVTGLFAGLFCYALYCLGRGDGISEGVNGVMSGKLQPTTLPLRWGFVEKGERK